MKKLSTEVDAFTGIVTHSFYDPEQDQFVRERVQDVEPLLDQNKRLYNDAPTRFNGELMEVADIPMVVVEQWFKEGLNIFKSDPDTRKRIREKLNAPDFRLFRTRPGRI